MVSDDIYSVANLFVVIDTDDNGEDDVSIESIVGDGVNSILVLFFINLAFLYEHVNSSFFINLMFFYEHVILVLSVVYYYG